MRDNNSSGQMELPSVEQLERELKRVKYGHRYRRTLCTTLFSLLIVAAIAVIIAVLLMPVMKITGNTMEETLADGDLVAVLNNGHYKTGDVISFYHNNSILIRRVIAVSGDWVDIDESGTVSVNGSELNEPYVSRKTVGECSIELPYQVPSGKCFVMGDQREISLDSRNAEIGCVHDDMVIGKLLLRFWPINRFGMIS